MIYFFFLNDTATTEIYPLSLHDALPIYARRAIPRPSDRGRGGLSRFRGDPVGGAADDRRHAQGHRRAAQCRGEPRDRKSTRLNSSHLGISYARFCLEKKKYALNTCTAE